MDRKKLQKLAEAIVKREKTKPIEVVRWWLAYRRAEDMREVYNTEDLAYIVQDGQKPMPKTWAKLMEIVEDDFEAVEMTEEEVLDNMREFYRYNENQEASPK